MGSVGLAVIVASRTIAPMSEKPHLLIPGAAPPAGATASPPLPSNLRALLQMLAPGERIECDEHSPSPPYELALARAHGLPSEPGRIPWAAFETGTAGQPCAWVHPCHWQVGADHVLLSPAGLLSLDEPTSRELMAAMAPYFLEDGIALHYLPGQPGRWLAIGETFRDLVTMALDRVAGRRLTPSFFNGSGNAAALLRRLQNEMQMLLYTHPATEARQRQGLVPVNSFWVTGAGELARPPSPAAGVQLENRLHTAAAQADAAAHAQAWNDVDAQCCAPLLARLRAGAEVRLTLCGEHAAQTWGPARSGGWRRAAGALGLQRTTLEALAL